MTRRLCIVLHDVAPATWPRCARLLSMLDALGGPDVTLLVVPDFHASGRIDADRDFRRAIEARLRRGDELALHGYEHRDRSTPPRAPFDWLRRRMLTASEGEFAALDRRAAADRLRRGLDLFARLQWPVCGFVPPAWLASAGTRAALHESALRYTSTHGALLDLASGRRVFAPCLTASPRSAWRRAVSRVWVRGGCQLLGAAQTMRAGLHPDDALHADLLAAWAAVLRNLLRRREAVTKSRALDAALRAAAHPV